MDYVDIPFPDRIAFGAQSSPTWSTSVAMTGGGSKTTNQNWSAARHEYDVSFAIRTASNFDLVVQHFHSVRGRAKKFPFKDYLDFTVSRARSTLIDNEDSDGTYTLAKTYGAAGPDQYVRRITRPRTGTVVIYRLRTGVTTDLTGDSTIDFETGIVEIDPTEIEEGDVLTWSGEFWVPCSYDTDKLPAVIINREGAGELLVDCTSIPVVEEKE